MVVLEVIAGALAAALAIAALGAVLLGGTLGALALIGAVRFTRCERCRHVGWVAPGGTLPSCAHCRHPLVLHPVHAVREHRTHHPLAHS